MSFKKGDQVTVRGIGGVFEVEYNCYERCAMGLSFYKLSNGSLYHMNDLRAYVRPPVLYKAMYLPRSFAPRFTL